MAARFEDVPETKAVEPFFSFTYDGKPSAVLLKTWELKRSSGRCTSRTGAKRTRPFWRTFRRWTFG